MLLKQRCKHLTEAIPDSFQYLSDILTIKAQSIDPLCQLVAEAFHLGNDVVPDAGNGSTELLVRIPKVHERRHQCADDRHHCYDRPGQTTQNHTQLAEHTAGTAHMGDKKPDTLCKRTESHIAVPTVDMVLPSTMSGGPMDAARSPILMIVSLVLSSMLLSLSTNFLHGRYDLTDGRHQDIAKEIASSSS